MKKTITLLVWSSCMLLFLNAAHPIEFRLATSLQEIQQAAKAENKLVMLNVGYEGCAPCAELDQQTMTYDPLEEYVNTYYVAYKIDANVQTDLANELGVASFPTIIVMNPERKLRTMTGQVKGDIMFSELRSWVRFEEQKALASKLSSTKELNSFSTKETARVQPASTAIQDVYTSFLADTKHCVIAQSAEGYALHVAQYKDIQAANQSIAYYEKLWKGEVWVYAQMKDNQLTYYVALGTYIDKNQAKEMQLRLASDMGINSELIDLSLIR